MAATPTEPDCPLDAKALEKELRVVQDRQWQSVRARLLQWRTQSKDDGREVAGGFRVNKTHQARVKQLFIDELHYDKENLWFNTFDQHTMEVVLVLMETDYTRKVKARRWFWPDLASILVSCILLCCNPPVWIAGFLALVIVRGMACIQW